MLAFDTIDLYHGKHYIGTQWRVYELYGNVKHYLAGYMSYDEMIESCPDIAQV